MNENQKQISRKQWKSARLLKHADFQAVYQQGKKYFSGNIAAFYRGRNDGAGPRVGFTVGKVLGGAVVRNRIRRRLRAAVQGHLRELAGPLDVVLHPRKQVLNIEFKKLDSEVGQIFSAIQKVRAK